MQNGINITLPQTPLVIHNYSSIHQTIHPSLIHLAFIIPFLHVTKAHTIYATPISQYYCHSSCSASNY
jgi:hypothetical protein